MNRKTGYPGVLESDLVRLLWGNGVSTLGNAVYLVAVLLLLKELTESALMMGLFQFVALFPGFLLSPLAGAIIDSNSRRRIIIMADVLRGVVMLVAGGLLLFPALRSPYVILVVSFCIGVGNAFFVPAAQALIPDIVPPDQLQRANGLRAGGNQIFNLTGNAIGGFLYAALGAPLLFAVNGLTFMLSALQELTIRAPRDRRRATGNVCRLTTLWQSAVEGFSAILSQEQGRTLFISQAGLFLLSPALLLALPFIVIDELGWSAGMVGMFFAISIAGGIAAFIAFSTRPVEKLLKMPVISLSYFSLAVVFIALGVLRNPLTLTIAALIFGAAAGGVYLFVVTWIQRCNSAHLHGRLFALLEAGNSLVAPASYVVTGLLLELLRPEQQPYLFLLLGGTAAVWAVRMIPVRTESSGKTSASVVIRFPLWYPEDIS